MFEPVPYNQCGHRLGHRGNSEDCVAAHVRTFERHLAEHERLDFGSAGDEANHARRKARFNVAFQSSAKLSKTRGGESPRFFPGAACDEKRRKMRRPWQAECDGRFLVGHLAGASSASL